ncbi:unnamed protein product [Nippostrongylus brasiliensis]|uniref:Uncharacterized protein n=1 Tax=Nippostrongylus brasiliensis TaxID=27835 RepID=A0A0N4Y8T2_NIPBR|nr:unnamed protein product [Nippostrongylus brasiliensis]
MQRIHGWLDQLTLRRSRRREALSSNSSRRSVSQSVVSSCRLNHEPKSKQELRPVHVPMVSAAAAASHGTPLMAAVATKPETGSFARRRAIELIKDAKVAEILLALSGKIPDDFSDKVKEERNDRDTCK